MSFSPPLDPDFRDVWDALQQLPRQSQRTLAEIRAPIDRSVFGEPPEIHHVEDCVIPAAGRDIPARLYRPCDKPDALIVYCHGGGWVMGSLETHDIPLRNFARLTGAAILSVAYRLAPEHPFPAPLEDCYQALVWAAQNLRSLAGDAVPLLVGGDSAGGNLAAGVAMATRDRDGPDIIGQILFYPALFADADKPSYSDHSGCAILTAEDMRWYWSCYAAQTGDRANALASPGDALDHGQLAPAIVAVAGIDPLRDDGIDYAELLRKAGAQPVVREYPKLPHGFFSFGSLVPAAMSATQEIASDVRALIRRAKESPR